MISAQSIARIEELLQEDKNVKLSQMLAQRTTNFFLIWFLIVFLVLGSLITI